MSGNAPQARPASSSNGTGTLRCAIYTRKSTDEGLEQAFNSLDAQRESAEACIASRGRRAGSALPDATTTAASPAGTWSGPHSNGS